MNAITTGNSIVQQNTIIVSKRTLGKVARNQTKTKQIAQVFNPKMQAWIFKNVLLINNSGKLYPPKKSIEVTALNKTIELYSAKK